MEVPEKLLHLEEGFQKVFWKQQEMTCDTRREGGVTMRLFSKMTDGDLARRLQSNPRDPEGWDEFFRRFREMMESTCRRCGVDDYEDMAVAVWIRVQERIAQLEEPDKIRNWVYVIARSVAIGDRRRKRPPVVPWPKTTLDDEESERTIEDLVPDPGPTPQEETLTGELRAVVRRAMEELSDSQRTCLGLFYEEGLKYREIAQIQGISIETVKSHIRRGKIHIESKLREYMQEPP